MEISNRDISRQFRLFAELLLIHGKDESLSDALSGSAYRLQRLEEPVAMADRPTLSKFFRPPIVELIRELADAGSIAVLDELIQLTPAGLFDIMRLKGLGGKKIHLL